MRLFQVIINSFLNYGYYGIFTLMFIGGTFIPLPSEIVMIPGGYFAAFQRLNLFWVIFAGTAGSIGGATVNYYLAIKLGRVILIKLKIIKQSHLDKSEEFFKKYGAISVCIAGVTPVVRRYISIPAGLSKMNKKQFFLYTAIGSGMWATFLACLGYFIGDNQILIIRILSHFNLLLILLVVIIIGNIQLNRHKKGWKKSKII
jgi:membrane protein DedA with SNARE-associated domain